MEAGSDLKVVGLEIGEIENGVVVVMGGGDFGGGEDRGGGVDSDGVGIRGFGVAGAGGVLAAVGEEAALEEVVGGGEEPSDFRCGTVGTLFGTHFREREIWCRFRIVKE